MTQISGAQMSQSAPKCAVWPFGTHRDPQEPQMTEIGAQMSQNSPKMSVLHRSRTSGASDDPNKWRTNEPERTQMCSLAIWHTSRPSGTSDDRNWRTNEPKLIQNVRFASIANLRSLR